jgi:hypothetical protein
LWSPEKSLQLKRAARNDDRFVSDGFGLICSGRRDPR